MIDLIQRSTIHGINHIYSATNIVFRFLWLVLFVIGITAISVNVAIIVIKYLSNPVLVSFTMKNERFIWPDFTFCYPTSPYLFTEYPSTLDHWNEVINNSKETMEYLINETNLFKLIHNMKITDFELEERTMTMSSANPSQLNVHKFGPQFLSIAYSKAQTGMFFTKEFEDRFLQKFKEDLRPMFTTQIVQIRNNIPCHTFHLDKSKLVKQSTVKSLLFSLRFNYENYKIFDSGYLSRSIFLYISNKNELSSEPIILSPGFLHSIELSQSRHHYNNLRRPCRTKIFEIKLYDALLQSLYTLEGDSNDCKDILSQKLFVKYCNCYSPFLPIYVNGTGFPNLCLNTTTFSKEEIVRNARCMIQVYERYQNELQFGKLLKQECQDYEAVKCDAISYNIKQRKDMFVEMWSNSTNDRRKKFLQNIYQFTFNTYRINKNYLNKLRDNFIELSLHRDQPYGDLYQEQPEYPFSELLSDIGGLMGLWLGMSIVGFFEILEYLYLTILGILCLNKKKEITSKENKEDDNDT